MREGNQLLWKNGFVYVFQFPNYFSGRNATGVIVFRACTSFFDTSYVFQSHYCNARFVPKMGFLYIGGTGSLTVRDTALKLSSSDTTVTEYLPRGVQKRRGWCGVGLSRGKNPHSRNGLCKDEFLREMCGRGDNGERNWDCSKNLMMANSKFGGSRCAPCPTTTPSRLRRQFRQLQFGNYVSQSTNG